MAINTDPNRDAEGTIYTDRSGLYTGLGLLALIVIGLIAYVTYEPANVQPTPPAPVTAPQ